MSDTTVQLFGPCTDEVVRGLNETAVMSLKRNDIDSMRQSQAMALYGRTPITHIEAYQLHYDRRLWVELVLSEDDGVLPD